MVYTPHTKEEKALMLEKLGVKSFQEFLSSIIPDDLLLKKELNLPEPLSELEAKKVLKSIANENQNTQEFTSFLGGGVYDHYIPAIVNHITARSEFYTAYTPYQAEVSQGTLQSIYEYQSVICELFQMEVSNASIYDGASALAEACHMARAITKRDVILVSETVHPFYRSVIKTYTQGLGIPVEIIPSKEGVINLDLLARKLDETAAAFLIQHPNFFGILEPMKEIESLVHPNKTLLVMCIDPISLGILLPPGAYDADIAVAEGQSLGIPQSFGGPFLGIFTTQKRYIRNLPGRIVGKTVDLEGKTGYALVLQTREQHIRRERATSNICTNEALCALQALIYLSIMGKEGIKEVANQSLQKSHYLAKEILKIPGFSLGFDKPFFKEFTLKTKIPPKRIIEEGLEEKIFAGIDLGQFDERFENLLLVAVTEKRTKQEMDKFVSLLKRLGS